MITQNQLSFRYTQEGCPHCAEIVAKRAAGPETPDKIVDELEKLNLSEYEPVIRGFRLNTAEEPATTKPKPE